MNKFFITNAIPYVNAKPHVGHALEFVQTDVIARYHKIIGHNVLTLCGGDENALKNVQAAEKEGKPIQEFIDANTDLFYDLSKKLNARFDVWQKGSSSQHHESSQKLWKLCANNGDIYEKEYSGLYCVGCELFYETEELNEHGECFEHPGKKLEHISETNYFFKLSKYQNVIEELIESDSIKIVPNERKNEILSFIKQGLKDISISRSSLRAKKWGVNVPGNAKQKMYVWFDALNIYQSGIGFGWNEETYRKWWPADIHLIGKGILRFHAVYWPAFLLSAKLKLPKSIYVHGYFTVDGQKMSKTIGNVIDPLEMIEKYGADTLRYYFLREIPSTADGDFSERRLKEIYNADLANGLGNLVARVAKLCEQNNVSIVQDSSIEPHIPYSSEIGGYHEHIQNFQLHLALEEIWRDIKQLDIELNNKSPWKLSEEQATPILQESARKLLNIAYGLLPFLPQTAEKILTQFSGKIQSSLPLFPRI